MMEMKNVTTAQPKNKRLNQSDRETLYALARKKVKETQDRTALDGTYDAAAAAISAQMKAMYPPADMAVLNRYEQASRDACIFYSTGGSNYERFQFRDDDDRTPLRPNDRGCNWRTPFLLEDENSAILTAYRNAEAEINAEIKRRENAFKALIWGAKSFNEVVSVWPGAEALRENIVGTGTALAVLSAEVVDRIRSDLALAA